MIEEIINVLQNKMKSLATLSEDLFKELQENKMTTDERLSKSLQYFKFSGQVEELNFAINTIRIALTKDKVCKEKEEIQEEKCACNCEKNHNNTKHTEEDDEEFEKIKKQLEVLKQYVPNEIKEAIDNFNFWYENIPNSEQCSLNEYKQYIKAILVVVYKTKRESDVWNKIMDQIIIISKMIKIEQ